MNTVVKALWGLAILASSSMAFASPSVETPHATVELVSQFEATAPGATQWIGIYFKPHDGWHVYWKNPGDSGLPPRAEFSSSPEGSKFGPLEFPTPERIPYGPIVNFGYEGEVLYPASWTASSDLKEGESVILTASVKWLICKQECVPGKALLSLKLPVGAADALSTASGTHTKAFATSLASLSKNPDGKIRLALSPDGSRIEIGFHGPEVKGLSKTALKSVFFFPDDDYGIGADAKQSLTSKGEDLSLSIPRKDKKPVGEIRGVFKLGEGKSYLVSEVIDPKLLASEKPKSTFASAPVDKTEKPSLVLMLLFAFIGGLILNLMPCVLPVLSIKVLGFANQAGSNRTEIRKHGLIFTAGVLVSFWIFAAILLIVRSSGQSLGWGFQLQNPIFVGSLAILFYLMALNLFGVFEIGDRWMGAGGKLASKEGYAGSFFTGVLTTVAATPCSAPFMGSALGFALTQSAGVAVFVLTVLAFGLSFPYLLFSFLPSASRLLPRPGAWMKTLKEVLAFPLLATVVWLVAVVGNQSGQDGMVMTLTAVLLSTVVAWLLGKPTSRAFPTTAKWVIIGVSAFFVLMNLSSLTLMRKNLSEVEPTRSLLVHEPWKAWSPKAQAEAIAAGKTVLVNFTADWCVTCKVNETLVFQRNSVMKVLAQDTVVALLADWTNSDQSITEALGRVGRNSVPVYLVYRPGVAEPKILPQLLSVDGLLNELGQK